MWEDDYCQIEIIPRENTDFIKKQLDTVSKFSKEHKTEGGFTDIFERNGNPFPTKAKKIPSDNFEKILVSSGLFRAKNIQIQNAGFVDYQKGATRAYGMKDFWLFWEQSNNIISTIWINTKYMHDKDSFNKVRKTINKLGRDFNLILVDWNSSEMIDLKDSTQTSQYFSKWQK